MNGINIKDLSKLNPTKIAFIGLILVTISILGFTWKFINGMGAHKEKQQSEFLQIIKEKDGVIIQVMKENTNAMQNVAVALEGLKITQAEILRVLDSRR